MRSRFQLPESGIKSTAEDTHRTRYSSGQLSPSQIPGTHLSVINPSSGLQGIFGSVPNQLRGGDIVSHGDLCIESSFQCEQSALAFCAVCTVRSDMPFDDTLAPIWVSVLPRNMCFGSLCVLFLEVADRQVVSFYFVDPHEAIVQMS